jgi:hypothetical protein
MADMDIASNTGFNSFVRMGIVPQELKPLLEGLFLSLAVPASAISVPELRCEFLNAPADIQPRP